MDSSVGAQVDSLDRDPRERDGCLDDLGAVADDREYAAMVDGIAGTMDDPRAGRFNNLDRSVERRGVAAFLKIWNDLEALQRSSADCIACAMSGQFSGE